MGKKEVMSESEGKFFFDCNVKKGGRAREPFTIHGPCHLQTKIKDF